MRIGIIGGGVVGHATGEAFKGVAEVRVYDIDSSRATHPCLSQALEGADLVFVCLPTPKQREGFGCDVSILDSFFHAVSLADDGWRNLNWVLRSTVPIGYTASVAERFEIPHIVHSPEFLTARTAVLDACNPTRMIIGCPRRPHGRCSGALRTLYRSVFPETPIFMLTSDESELVKLAQNTFSAVKIAFFNELRDLSDSHQLDWDKVLEALLAGGWINPMHTQVPGPDGQRGFGGSCLPKDLENFIDCCDKKKIPRLMAAAALTRNTYMDRRSK